MALKNFMEISKSEFGHMSEGSVRVIEKLDMLYFRVAVGNHDIYIMKGSERKSLTDVDCALNDINAHIVNFVDTKIRPYIDELFDIFGYCTIGFFYLPKQMTKHITYHYLDDETFILSDLYTEDRKKNDMDKLRSFCVINWNIETEPIISTDVNLKPSDWADLWNATCERDAVKCARILCGEKTFTGNRIDDILGIIVESNGKKYRITINEFPHTEDKYIKMMYHDKVLSDFISVVTDDDIENAVLSSDNYLYRISTLFGDYINKTDIFSKMFFDNDDLVPPIAGYCGNICFDKLSPTARLICMYDETKQYEKILRILINAFRTLDTKTFKNVDENKYKKFNYILEKLHERRKA